MAEQEKMTLELLHEAAKTEFMEKGFQGASLRNIVKTAGVTTGAFYGYYNSKEELFKALVGETYEYILGEYKNSLKAFENLPLEQQPEAMGKISRECMKRLLFFAHEHSDETYMILQCSEGTRYAFLVEEMVELEIDATEKYCRVLGQLGYEAPHFDRKLEHILVTGMMNAYFELIIHELPLDEAIHYAEELNDFYTAGWLKIMGQE